MGTKHCGLLIVGAGHAGSELAIAARQGGWVGRIVLLGDEIGVPYQLPPLSKSYLLGKADLEALALRPTTVYEALQIERMQGTCVVSIDRMARSVMLADGSALDYEKLALCTGGRPRPLLCDGIDQARPPANLFTLRTLADADGMRAQLRPGTRVVVVGGGYVGLEVAASARWHGAEVTVLEAQPRVLARVAGDEVSQFYQAVHREAGVTILTSTSIASMQCQGDRIVAAHCSNGLRLEADLVLAGIGMLPNIEAARAAGLAQEGVFPSTTWRVPPTPTSWPQATARSRIMSTAGNCDSNLYPMHWNRREQPPRGCVVIRSLIGRCPGSGRTSTISSCRWSACLRGTTTVSCVAVL